MKKIIPGLMGLLFISSACRKSAERMDTLSGTYTGRFLRVSMAYQGPASVKIDFSGNSFDGEALDNNYPDICHGTYQIKGDSINFKNECVLPADFDWSLILSGKYRIYHVGDSLSISRMYPGTVIYSDTYTLKKE
ncbi:MAG: hypothetical protein Q8918_05995 [Bacteroidota bacterium]|nr:hypothetical protein [Bacteroidota bacterium]